MLRVPFSVNKSTTLKSAAITVVVAGNTYSLRADDPRSMRDIPANDRDQLMGVLEALKAEYDKSQRVAQAALARSSGAGAAAPRAVGGALNTQSGERLGKGDVDAIMARLIMEERQQQKPGLQRSTIYKFAAAIVVLIILLSVF